MTERRMVGAKRLLVLLGCCAALGGTVYFVHGFQLRRNASGLLDRARQAEEEGQNTQALDYLSQYIGLVPSDTDALARLGRLLDKSARTVKEKEKAYFVLDQVLRRDPERHDVRRDVVRLATELQRFDDARFHLERLVKDLPPDAELFGLTGRCDAAAHKYNDAAKSYARAVELDATRVDLAAEYAALLRDRLDMPEVADAVVRDLLTANERSLPARLVAARHFLTGGVPDRAEDHVRFALDELGADDAETLALAAAVAVARGKPDEARRRLERGLELHADDSRLRQDLARLEGRSGRRDRALELLRPLLKDLPDSPSELWERGNLLIDLENETGVDAVLLKLQKGGPAWAVVILRARLSILHEAWGDARLALERLRNDKFLPKPVDLQAHLLLADCYAALGNPDEQALACRQALEIEPTSLPALIRLAGALVALHKPDAAIELYRKLARQVPEVRLEVVRLLVEKVLTLPASKARHWDEVEKAFADLSDGQRNSATGLLLRADVLAAQDKLAEARAEAVKARDADPKAPAPWLYLMELDRRHDKSANVLSLLNEAEKQVGKRLEWDLVRARHWAAVGGDEGAKRLKEIAGTIRVPAGAAQARLLLPLGLVYAGQNEPATAKRLWLMLADKLPGDLRVRLVLLEEAVRGRDGAATRALQREIERAEGEKGPMGLYARSAVIVLAARAGDKQGLPEARQDLRRAIALRPSWPRPNTLLAEVEEIAGNKDQTLREYLDAFEHGENRLTVVRRILQLLYESRRYAEAAALLEKIPEDARTATHLDRISAELAFVDDRLEDPAARKKQALERARKAVAGGKATWQDLLWLGQMAFMAGETKEAETALRQARDVADKEPATWMALIQLLARTDPARAKVELAEAERRLPAKVAPLALAACCEVMGQKDDAARHLQTALKADPASYVPIAAAADFYNRAGQFDKAEPLLRRLLEPSLKKPAPVAEAARRTLAVALAQQFRETGIDEALALVDENLKNGSADADRRAKVLILAARPERRVEAIKLLEEMAPLEPKTPPELLYVLARLYQAEGNWPQAMACVHAILRSHGDQAAALVFLARGLLREGDIDEARTYVARLEQTAPKELVTLELRARVLAASGKKAEAISLVDRRAKQDGAPIDQLAMLLDDLGGFDAAEKLYRRHIADSKKPESVLLLATHFVRRGRLPEALDICEAAWKTCPIENVGHVSAYAVIAGKGGPDDVRRVEGWFKDALSRTPDSAALISSLSDIYAYADRRADAMNLYREMLRRNERNVIALNNLACLLAFEPGKNEEALALANRTIALAGSVPALLDTRALILLQSDRPDRALKDAEQVVIQAPTAGAQFRLAQAQLKAGRRPEATASFHKAVRLGLKEEEMSKIDRAGYRDLARELN